MLADTSSAPAGSTLDAGTNAAELASLIEDPMFARSVAAAATYSGAAITYDIPLPRIASHRPSPPAAKPAQPDRIGHAGNPGRFQLLLTSRSVTVTLTDYYN